MQFLLPPTRIPASTADYTSAAPGLSGPGCSCACRTSFRIVTVNLVKQLCGLISVATPLEVPPLAWGPGPGGVAALKVPGPSTLKLGSRLNLATGLVCRRVVRPHRRWERVRPSYLTSPAINRHLPAGGGDRSTKDRSRAFRSHSGAHLEYATAAKRRALIPPARVLLRTLKGGFGVRYTEEIVEHNIVSYLTIFGTVAGWVLIAA